MQPVDPPSAGRRNQKGDVERNLASLGNILRAIIVLIGLLPSVVIITGLIDIPPNLQQLVKIVTIPVSIVGIITIIALGDDIARWSPRKTALIFIICLALGASSTVAYFLFAKGHVIEFKDERLVAPIHPSERVRAIIAPYDDQYDQALENSPRSDELRDLLAQESVVATIVMIVLMVLSQLLLVTAIVGSAWKLVVGTVSNPPVRAPRRPRS
jgi:hypothetical protein